jgi:hypothetical protein
VWVLSGIIAALTIAVSAWGGGLMTDHREDPAGPDLDGDVMTRESGSKSDRLFDLRWLIAGIFVATASC